ncbi:hypothetical protein EON67_08910, partial [archaeon]
MGAWARGCRFAAGFFWNRQLRISSNPSQGFITLASVLHTYALLRTVSTTTSTPATSVPAAADAAPVAGSHVVDTAGRLPPVIPVAATPPSTAAVSTPAAVLQEATPNTSSASVRADVVNGRHVAASTSTMRSTQADAPAGSDAHYTAAASHATAPIAMTYAASHVTAAMEAAPTGAPVAASEERREASCGAATAPPAAAPPPTSATPPSGGVDTVEPLDAARVDEWEYVDESGNVQGPFTSAQMATWTE